MALLARGMVRDEAHRIQRLAGRTRGDQRAPAGERPVAPQHRVDGGDDLDRLRHAAGAVFVAGHGAVVGTHEDDTAFLQRFDVGHGRGVGPHAHVHRRRREHRLVGGEQHGGGEIVGQAARHARQQIGGRRRHDQQVGIARELDVAHLALVGQGEHVAVDTVFREGLQREGRDELRAGFRQHAAHRGAAPAQEADQFSRLEGGNAARDDQQDTLAVQHDVQPITRAGWRQYRGR